MFRQKTSCGLVKEFRFNLKYCFNNPLGGFGRNSTFEGRGEPIHRHPEPGGGVREERPTTQSGEETIADERSGIIAGEKNNNVI
jgi:hypothetical protein